LSSYDHEKLFRQYAPVINPDGEIKKKGNNITCGSISMNIESGLWHRFSNGDGGNIFTLMKIAGNYSIYDAIGNLRNSSNVTNKRPRLQNTIKDEWITFKEVPKDARAFNPIHDLKHMLYKNTIENIYDYKNEYSDVIGHSVRFVSKLDNSKSILPVSYCYNKLVQKSEWRLKGFNDGDGFKPMYGLEKLGNNKKVLIVEGEKTADIAQKLFPEYSVISWLGGVQNASKVDWSKLKNKAIIIWPDNDKVGINAAFQINSLCDFRANIINPNAVKIGQEFYDLPNKWDLADPLPHGLSINNLREAIRNSEFEKNRFTAKDEVRILQQKYLGMTFSDSKIDEKKNFDEQYHGRKTNFIDHLESVANAKIYEPAKKELFTILVRDAMLDIKLRFESLAGKGIMLDQNIKDKIVRDANKIIMGIKLQKRGDISLSDQVKSSKKLQDHISSNSWWREVLHMQRNRSRHMQYDK
jgi:hypothetical protein